MSEETSPDRAREQAAAWLRLYRDLGVEGVPVAPVAEPATADPPPSEPAGAGPGELARGASPRPAGPARSAAPAEPGGRRPHDPPAHPPPGDREPAARPGPAASSVGRPPSAPSPAARAPEPRAPQDADAPARSPAPGQPALLGAAADDAAAIATIVEATDPAEARLERLRRDVIGACTRCRLHEGRRHVVFGVGNPQAQLMFVGEGPGADEDRKGEPFVGRAGQLLDRIIEAMGRRRADVYIANVVKCRPPDNRAPMPDEQSTCVPFLRAQVAIIRPEVIVTLGKVALEGLLGDRVPSITRVRGRWFTLDGVPVMATFHPAYLLRNPAAKRPVWQDMQEVMARLAGDRSR